MLVLDHQMVVVGSCRANQAIGFEHVVIDGSMYNLVLIRAPGPQGKRSYELPAIMLKPSQGPNALPGFEALAKPWPVLNAVGKVG